MSLDALVHAIQRGEFAGKQTATITMKNDRTLTTLIFMDGQWLADMIWFKYARTSLPRSTSGRSRGVRGWRPMVHECCGGRGRWRCWWRPRAMCRLPRR